MCTDNKKWSYTGKVYMFVCVCTHSDFLQHPQGRRDESRNAHTHLILNFLSHTFICALLLVFTYAKLELSKQPIKKIK